MALQFLLSKLLLDLLFELLFLLGVSLVLFQSFYTAQLFSLLAFSFLFREFLHKFFVLVVLRRPIVCIRQALCYVPILS